MTLGRGMWSGGYEVGGGVGGAGAPGGGGEDLHPMTRRDYQSYLEMDMPVLAWSSQAKGVMTKAMAQGWDALPEAIKKKYDNPQTKRSLSLVKELCKKYHITATQAALGYIVCNRLPAAAIIGPNRLEQLADSWEAAGLTLPAEAVEALKWEE